MIHFINDNVIDTQNSQLKRRGRQPLTDIHCHLLPGLDDGPKTMAESLVLCQRLVEEGIGIVAATPHQLGRFDGCNEAAQVRQAVCKLNEELSNSDIALTVVPGGEIRTDERICQLLEADKILTLADSGRYILLELPYEIFIDIEPLLVELASMGIQAIIAHPERNAHVARQLGVLSRWLENCAGLAITAFSLLGDFGPQVQRTAWQFLSLGWARFVATDAHGVYIKRPRMRAAYKCISTRFGENLASLVCIENPSRVINGQEVVPIFAQSKQETEW